MNLATLDMGRQNLPGPFCPRRLPAYQIQTDNNANPVKPIQLEHDPRASTCITLLQPHRTAMVTGDCEPDHHNRQWIVVASAGSSLGSRSGQGNMPSTLALPRTPSQVQSVDSTHIVIADRVGQCHVYSMQIKKTDRTSDGFTAGSGRSRKLPLVIRSFSNNGTPHMLKVCLAAFEYSLRNVD